jgi:hypothetical protein
MTSIFNTNERKEEIWRPTLEPHEIDPTKYVNYAVKERKRLSLNSRD